jgi:PAS domain S-box-containing protein
MTENLARPNEAEWRELFEHSHLMYFTVDAAGIVLSVNDSGAAALGYRVDELVGQSALKVFADSDRERVRRNLDLCLERPGQLNTWEAQKIRKDGTALWVGESAKAVERAQDGVVVLIACEDITQRKRAEESARESATRFRALIEHAFDVVVLQDREHGILYASPSVERVFGYAPRELVGRDSLDFIHPDQREDARNRFATALVSPDSVLPRDRLIQHKNGTWLWTETTMTNLLGEPSVRAIVVNLRDISGRKQAEQALRESEQRFRDYAETASDWFWEIGPDYKFTLLTENAFGSKAVDRIGTACWDGALDLETEPEKWRLIWATLDSRQPFRDFVYCSMSGNGSPIYVKASGKPVFDANGEFRGYRGTGTDVSDTVRAKKAERALQDVRMELARVSRITSLGALTASIAHEINQPLASLRMNAGAGLRWLRAEPPNLEEVRQGLERIRMDGARAGEVIERIRALARKAPVKVDPLDLNEAIREVITLTRSEIIHNRIALRTQLAELAPTQGDKVQLQQVILNLILNAIEAMGDDESRDLLIETRENDGRNILVSVSDSGPGLDPATVDRIFEPFYSTKQGGMGIGLSICRTIIEAHEGRIWVQQNNGRGSTFQFTLPVANTLVEASGPSR